MPPQCFTLGFEVELDPSTSIELKIQNSSEPIYQVYGNDGIWYDAINELLSLYLLKPNNSNLQADWLKFTKAKGVNLQIPQLN